MPCIIYETMLYLLLIETIITYINLINPKIAITIILMKKNRSGMIEEKERMK